MRDNPSPSTRDVWIRLILLFLGIIAPIIVARIFRDNVYLALVITVIILVLLFLVFLSSKTRIIAMSVTAVVAIILGIFYYFSDRPRFEVNFLGLPLEGDNAYFVTDALIHTGGDLSEYSDFTLSPVFVEVIPHYLGDQKYGNTVLRVSGNQGMKDYVLWEDFDKSAQTQTVEISLADILEVSGIRENREEQDTNLMLGEKPFQEASIKFEVLRLSEPERPFNSSRELLVRNAPWKQAVSVVWRDGWVLDYALTNLGGEAKFHCRVNIAKTLSDVGDNDVWFWSGTEIFSYGPNCDPFSLKTDETYKASFPLNEDSIGKEFHHGRYLVQVYTYVERSDIEFNSGYDYEDSGDIWLFSGAGNVETFVVCNDPGMTCAQTDTLTIEEVTVRAYPYSSLDELDNGITYFWVRTYLVDNRPTNQYILDYWLDPKKEGWAGFGIWFEDLLDVSTFNSIRFKLTLDASLHPIWLDVKGKVGDAYTTSRVGIGNGTYGTPKSEEQTVVVPFSAFTGIDWTMLDTLYFVIDSNIVPDTEQHQIRISEFEFIR